MQWWCAALGETWTWNWRAYPGVWFATGNQVADHVLKAIK